MADLEISVASNPNVQQAAFNAALHYGAQALAPTQKIEGTRLTEVRPVRGSEGVVIPRVYGTCKISGTVIWCSKFNETKTTDKQGGKGGGGPKTETTNYVYRATIAIALCEGEITSIGRMWAGGELFDYSGATYRLYKGSETQLADPAIEAIEGAGNAPAYRGLAYIVFEDLELTPFGNSLPQLQIEVFRNLGDSETLESRIKSVCIIPGSGEFVYDTTPIRELFFPGTEVYNQNTHTAGGKSDVEQSVLNLLEKCPNLKHASFIIAWFGNDLRVGECELRPGVERNIRVTAPREWRVEAFDRTSAHQISWDADNRPIYGGTPNDAGVIETIQLLKAHGIEVTLYPFILMDIPAGNGLADPYGKAEQAVLPWRGRITQMPAAGQPGTPDGTAAAAAQVDAFFNGPNGFVRFITHMANLAVQAGGVESILIGSEMRGLTSIRSAQGVYPAVAHLKTLAETVRGIVGADCKISYAADWTEYGHHTPIGTNDVDFPLDSLWGDSNIDFIGIDMYAPLADWRDGDVHIDAQIYNSNYDIEYLKSNMEGGEGYDWYYASQADRDAQVRTPITDGAYNKPWVFRQKDIRNWHGNLHYVRVNGVEVGVPTDWVPSSKPIRFTEIGFPSADKGANQPNVFYDPKSSESYLPHYSRGTRDDFIQRVSLLAYHQYYSDTANNPSGFVDADKMSIWAWDARPFPTWPALTEVWSDGANWVLGHWLNGKLGASDLADIVRAIVSACLPQSQFSVTNLRGLVGGYFEQAIQSPRSALEPLMKMFGFEALEDNGVIIFQHREDGGEVTVQTDELVDIGDSPFEFVLAEPIGLPYAEKWISYRSDSEQEVQTASFQWPTAQSRRIAQTEFPMSVVSGELERNLRRHMAEAHTSRDSARFTLPPSMLAVTTADRVKLSDELDATFLVRQTSDGDVRKIEAYRYDGFNYDFPSAVSSLPQAPDFVASGPPAVSVLNLPWLSASNQARSLYVAAYVPRWSESLAVYLSSDDGVSWSNVGQITQSATMGYLNADLLAGPDGRWDYDNTIDLTLFDDALDNADRLSVLAGGNLLAIDAGANKWELVQFENANLTSSKTYTLDTLLRTRRGTNDVTYPIPAGARVVLIDAAVIEIDPTLDVIDAAIKVRVGPGSEALTDSSFSETDSVFLGRGFLPFSPSQMRAARQDNGDVKITWLRRDRDPDSDSWVDADIPMSETSEAYQLKIISGGNIVRTEELVASSYIYTSAQQTLDLGGAGGGFQIEVAQRSSIVGLGVPAILNVS